jgi:hypothetical protein
VAEAVTAMSAAGLGVGVALVLVDGVGVGVGVAAGVVALIVAPVGPVPVAVGELAVADGELAAAVTEPVAWAADGELVALMAAELTVPDADAETVADAVEVDGVVVARAVPATPLVMTKRPVARPTVTGRECADRMRTTLSVVAIAAGKRTRRDVVSIWGFEMHFGCTRFYSTPIPAPDATPASHVTSHRYLLVTKRYIRPCRLGRLSPVLTVRRFPFPDRFPSMPLCPKENRACPFRPAWAACAAQAVTRRPPSSAGRRPPVPSRHCSAVPGGARRPPTTHQILRWPAARPGPLTILGRRPACHT